MIETKKKPLMINVEQEVKIYLKRKKSYKNYKKNMKKIWEDLMKFKIRYIKIYLKNYVYD